MYTFRRRLIVILLGLVVLTQLVTMGIFVARSHIEAKEEAAANLVVSGNMLQALLTSKGQERREAVQISATDFGFKSSVASGDETTIRSTLANMANRIGADSVTLLDIAGKTVSSTDPALMTGRWLNLSLPDTNTSEAASSYQTLNGQLLLLVVAPVRAPITVGYVVVGFPVDQKLVTELSDLLDVSVGFTEVGRNSAGTLISNLPPDQAQETLNWLSSTTNRQLEATEIEVSGHSYLGLVRDMPDGRGAVKAVLQQPLQSALAATYTESALIILLIGAVAILLAIPPARWLAKQASRPLEALLAVAKRIEAGDYRKNIHLSGSIELEQVASTLNAMQSQIASREQQVKYLASHDAITGLPNRLSALQQLQPVFDQTTADQQRLPLLLLEVSDYVRMQIALGHDAAESLLCDIALKLTSLLGRDDLLASPGPGQFLIVKRSLSCTNAADFAQTLIDALNQEMAYQNTPISLGAEASICYVPDHAASPLEALRHLDLALHDTSQFSQSVRVYRNTRQADLKMQLVLLSDLRRAIQDNLLSLHYQPKVNLLDGRILGVEALVRWQHPVLGAIAPDTFIPLLERTRSIWQLTRWLIQTVPKQMRLWRDQGFEPMVSINLSASDLLEQRLPQHLLDCLAQADISPHKLMLEITESAIMNEPDQAVKVMQQLRAHGLRFSVDDFGTGYSSLAQFKSLPVDELKIDRSFVKNMQPGSDDAIIVQTTIDLGHRFGVKVVAEGIETTENWQQLLAMGCDQGQGYLISKPLPPERLLAFSQMIDGRFEPVLPALSMDTLPLIFSPART
jgi:diguanylate cyclase (GGDEF)-like protein